MWRQAPLKLAADSYQALADYLIQPANNDIGMARSFFVWIASQRLQDIMDFVDNTLPPEDSPLYTVLLMLLKQWGNGYSELFSNLCRYVFRFALHFLVLFCFCPIVYNIGLIAGVLKLHDLTVWLLCTL